MQHGVTEINSPYSELHCSQSQPHTRYRAGWLVSLFQRGLGLGCPPGNMCVCVWGMDVTAESDKYQ